MRPRKKPCLLRAAVIVLAVGWICSAPGQAGVVVLANRTAAKVEFAIARTDGQVSRHSIKPGDVFPVAVSDTIGVTFHSGGELRRRVAEANSIHYFLTRNGSLVFPRLALPWPPGGEEPPPRRAGPRLDSVYTIPVMILTDDDEPRVRRLWEKLLRQRVQKASGVFEHHCRVRFEVVAVGTWQSDDFVVNFKKSLREFELKVTPAPARLAIGFTSQYKIPRGQTHLGGTRGPLHSHILIREWSQHISKTERLEVLVHELGHFLGASHSPERNSVMRPLLGDRRSRARDFRIRFDPVNTLIMNLVAEEVRTRRVRGLWQVRPATKVYLRSAYLALSEVMPKDPAAEEYLELLDPSPKKRSKPPQHPKPLVAGTRAVVRAIVEAAGENRRSSSPLRGDRLMESYVRRAAAAAAKLPPEVGREAFLVGLGIGVDSSGVLRYTSIVSNLCRGAESAQERRQRLKVLGSPTMRGRRDLAQHFVVSCALTVLVGAAAAETAGIAKELKDARRGSGFSFVDLCADTAGVTFASALRDGKITLPTLAASFAVNSFLPEQGDLTEGIAWDEFFKTYGSAEDDRFHRQQEAIRKRILALPGYKKR